ncbi:MAG TPA: tetratricopeptide repeat protein [Thermoanaerobaculia bacterium]|jgi:tetratricopeptide (TPR) repeat protein|nr:tetratricopeptide repeat protein [Thermoanaerobaculia bacterium]
MRAYVFTDKSLERYAGRFVWLAINTEDSRNANFLAKYPMPVLPTLLVLDSTGEKIVMRYVGGATLPQLEKLLDDASKKTQSSSDFLVASADKLASEGRHADAAKLYESALEKAPKSWRRYGPTAESLLFSLSSAKDYEHCATRALDLYARLKSTRSGANVAASGLDCATSIDEKNAQRADLIRKLDVVTREALADKKIELAGDDRSGMYITLIAAREALKDEEGAQKLRQEWTEFLEKAAAQAKTPEQRAVYDSHRLTAYLELKTPEKAIPMLEQSERDFPDDYNPPARLASAYKAMKEYDKALAASDRALARAYGPRKLLILRNRADIYVAKGDKESAKKTMEEAIAYAKQLPKAQVRESTIAALEKKLTELSQ